MLTPRSRSEHSSPKYGKYYTQEEIHDLFAPSEDSVSTVRDWLERSGIASDRISQSFNKQWIQFDAAISELEDLIKAKVRQSLFHYGQSETPLWSTKCLSGAKAVANRVR